MVNSLPLLEKTWKKGSSFLGNFVTFKEKIGNIIREICYAGIAGEKFCPACQEINLFDSLPHIAEMESLIVRHVYFF